MEEVIVFVVLLVAVKDGILPDPLAANPTAVLLLAQVKVVLATGPDGVVEGTVAPLQKFWPASGLTVAVG